MSASNLELVRHVLIETSFYLLPIPEPSNDVMPTILPQEYSTPCETTLPVPM